MSKVHARGVNAGVIFEIDDETVVVPFSWNQLNVIKNALEFRAKTLESSGDYPEKNRDAELLSNIKTAMSMIRKI